MKRLRAKICLKCEQANCGLRSGKHCGRCKDCPGCKRK